MKIAHHYYSVVSGLAASLGSFFGKMITYSSDEMVRKRERIEKRRMFYCRCCCVCGTRIDAILHFSVSRLKFYKIFALKWFKSGKA